VELLSYTVKVERVLKKGTLDKKKKDSNSSRNKLCDLVR
jgi:hypothetical protein